MWTRRGVQTIGGALAALGAAVSIGVLTDPSVLFWAVLLGGSVAMYALGKHIEVRRRAPT